MKSSVALLIVAAVLGANAFEVSSGSSPYDLEKELVVRGLKDFFNKKNPGTNIGKDNAGSRASNDTDSRRPDPNNPGNSSPDIDNSLNDITGEIGLGRLMNQLQTMIEQAQTNGATEGFSNCPGSSPNRLDVPEMEALSNLMDLDMESIPKFRVPEFYYSAKADKIYDQINFEEVRERISAVLNQSRSQYLPPREINNKITTVLFGLKSRCTVNALQGLISAGLTRWANNRTAEILEHAQEVYPDHMDGVPELLKAVIRQVMSEVNRTIFGTEFTDFISVAKFIERAVTYHTMYDETVDPASVVVHLSEYLIQCTPTATFLEGFLSRLDDLRRRVLLVNPLVFTVRLLQDNTPPCDIDRLTPSDVQQSYITIREVLKPIQGSLKKMVSFVESALFFENDAPIVNIFPDLLGSNKTRFLSEVLTRLRHPQRPVNPSPDPIDNIPEPYQNSSDLIPQRATTSPDLSPPTSPPTPPMTTAETSEGGTPTPQTFRRAEEDVYEEVKLLDLLLKRLVAAKRNNPR